MTPTIGRIVHYKNLGDAAGKYPPEIQAAIVTKVHNDTCLDLTIFYPTGIFMRSSVTQESDETGSPTPGHWQWPPRV